MYAKPLPVPTHISRPHWDALRQHKLLIQRCRSCQGWVFYPRSHCSHCLSPELDWVEVSGAGMVYTFSISRVPTLAEFADEVPQLLAVIELAEGVRINSLLVGVEPETVWVGMSVRPVFVDIADQEVTLLRFTPELPA